MQPRLKLTCFAIAAENYVIDPVSVVLHGGNIWVLLQLFPEIKKIGKTLQQNRSEDSAIVSIMRIYFVLVDAPYPDDWVSPSSEEPVESRVQLQCIHPIPIVFFHLISNDIRHLKQRVRRTVTTITCVVPSNTPTYVCIFRSVRARNSEVSRSYRER